MLKQLRATHLMKMTELIPLGGDGRRFSVVLQALFIGRELMNEGSTNL